MPPRQLALGLVLGSVLGAALPGSARAESFLEIVNGTASRTTTGTNQVVGAGVGFIVGKLRLSLDAGQRAFITYTFQGAEATLRDQFFGPGLSSLIDTHASVGTLITTSLAPGLLDFAFQSPGIGGTGVGNAGNYAWNDASFGVVLDSGRMSGKLLFEDGRGRLGPDYDYDDMVVNFKIGIAPVPEASSIAMLLAGVGVLAWMRRRRRAPAIDAPA